MSFQIYMKCFSKHHYLIFLSTGISKPGPNILDRPSICWSSVSMHCRVGITAIPAPIRSSSLGSPFPWIPPTDQPTIPSSSYCWTVTFNKTLQPLFYPRKCFLKLIHWFFADISTLSICEIIATSHEEHVAGCIMRLSHHACIHPSSSN